MKKKIIVPVVALALGTSSLAGCKQNPAPKPSAPTLSSLRFDTTAMTLEYVYEAVAVSLEGLKVYAVYSDSSETEVSDYTWNAADLTITQEDRAGAKFGTKKKVAITYQTKSKNLEFTIKPEVVDWDEETLALMDSHLLGVHLPFNRALKNMTYESGWDDEDPEYEYFYINAEGTYDQDSLTAYKATFLESEGWETSTQTSGEGKVINFQKEVARDNDAPAVIQGAFTVVNSAGTPAATGNFALSAQVFEPYVKEWPTAKVASLVAHMASSSEVTVPSFEAGYYQVVPAEGNYLGYIVGFEVNENPITAYEAKLTGWTIDEESTSPRYALSPDEKFGIKYKYDATNKYFLIYIAEAEKKSAEWPTADVASMVSSYAKGESVPEFTGAGLADIESFKSYLEYGVIEVTTASGKENDVISAYSTILEASYSESSFFDGRFVSPQLNIDVTIAQATSGTQKVPQIIYIRFFPHQPNEYLEYDGTFEVGHLDSFPSAFNFQNEEDGMVYPYYEELYYSVEAAYTSVTVWSATYNASYYYYYYDSTTEQYVRLSGSADLTSQEMMDAAIAQYGAVYEISWPGVDSKAAALQQALLADGFFPYYTDGSGNQHYASPNEEFEVSIQKGSSAVEIPYAVIEEEEKMYTKGTSFPSEAIATMFEGYTAIPSVNGGSSYLYAAGNGTFAVLSRFADNAAAEAAATTYKASLTAYTETPAESGIYVATENGDIQIEVSVIGVYVATFITDIAVFPLNGLNGFFGEAFTSEQVPTIEKAAGLKFKGEGNETTGAYTITITYASAEAASAAKTTYEAALVEKEFVETTENSGIYGNVALALQVSTSTDGANLVLVFKRLYKSVTYGSDLATLAGFSSSAALNLPRFNILSNVACEVSFDDEYSEEDFEFASSTIRTQHFNLMANNFNASTSWDYIGSTSQTSHFFQNTLYNWIVVRVYAWGQASFGVQIQIDENNQALSLFAGLPSYDFLIPAINENDFKLDFTSVPGSAVVTFDVESEDAATAAVAEYIDDLEDYDYTLVDGVYVSDELDPLRYTIKVEKFSTIVEEQTTWSVKITIAPYDYMADLVNDLNDIFDVEDYSTVIPSVASNEVSDVAYDEGELFAMFAFADDEAAEAAATAYGTALVDNYGFTDNENGTYSKTIGETTYTVSFIPMGEDSGLVQFSVIVAQAESEFDNALAALNELCSGDYKTIFPSVEASTLVEAYSSFAQGYEPGDEHNDPYHWLQMHFVFDSVEELNAALTAYLGVLDAKGFDEMMENYYVDSTYTYTVTIVVDGTDLYIGHMLP